MIYRRGDATASSILYMGSFFIIILMIVVGIYGGFVSFFREGYDSRYTESRVLLNKVKDCFDSGKITFEGLNEESLVEKCVLNKDILNDGEHIIYLKDSSGSEFSFGVDNFRVGCGLNARFDHLELPLCASFEYGSGNYILVGSSQNSRRVSA